MDRWRVVFSSCETLTRTRRDLRARRGAALVAPFQIVLRGVFSVFFPSECRLCRTPLGNVSTIPVCDECVAEIHPLRAPQCVICGDRMVSAHLLMGDGRCVNCRDSAPAFERAVSFGAYDDNLRGLIHLLKYENVTPVAGLLGGMMAQAVEELLVTCSGSTPWIMPVPLHKSRRRTRGFNQAELIARAALRRLRTKLEVASDVLVRHRETISQVGLSREERIANVHGAFRVTDRHAINGRDIIVVDDVMTTGTTLSECARVLKEAGAKRVWAATVARAFQDGHGFADGSEQEEIEAESVVASV